MVEPIERISLWIKARVQELTLRGPSLNNDLYVVHAIAKLFRELVESTRSGFLDVVIVQR